MRKPEYVGGIVGQSDLTDSESVRRSTVLVVDDERIVRVSVRRVLERHGYAVLEAENGAAALQLIEKENEVIDLVVMDVVMPEMSGVQLAEQIHAAKIPVPIIYISGYLTDSDVREVSGNRNRWMLAKPFFPATLMSAVQIALATRDS